MSTTVVYHSADFDGLFCREIALKFLPDAEFIGWNFGDPPVPLPITEDPIYVLDLPIDQTFGLERAHKGGIPMGGGLYLNTSRFIWIDHHKSAIESHPDDIRGYRIDGVAACRLSWQWFRNNSNGEAIRVPLADYLDRKVSEPLAVRLAGEYDIWDKRDPDAELFQHGLRSEEPDFQTLLQWPAAHAGRYLTRLLNQGRAIQYSKTRENDSIIKHIGFTIQFEGLTFLACNHAQYNSHLFTAGLKPEHDACFGFKWNGKGKWEVSLYHAPGKEHHDLSKIAVKHGGGGHKGACGFITDKLPFL